MPDSIGRHTDRSGRCTSCLTTHSPGTPSPPGYDICRVAIRWVVGTVSDKAGKNGSRWLFIAIAAGALVAGVASRLRTRSQSSDADGPTDVGFMRAMHDAMRRDLTRLRAAAEQLDATKNAPSTVLAGWDGFRDELEFHHRAEDDDLWPVLRRELTEPDDIAAIDA